MSFAVVKPLPGYEHLKPFDIVGYNGCGKPCAVRANPEDLFFVYRSVRFSDRQVDNRANACLWIIPGTTDGSE